jgi:hypothetical protein
LYVSRGLLSLANVTLPGRSAPIGADAPPLTDQQLQAAVSTALVRLENAGVDPALVARLASAHYEVGNLPAPLLGYTFARDNTVVIDANADGYGWSVDPTAPPAAGHMDLLTTVLHEMGHLDGRPDVNTATHPNNLMDATLAPGVRRTAALDATFASGFV